MMREALAACTTTNVLAGTGYEPPAVSDAACNTDQLNSFLIVNSVACQTDEVPERVAESPPQPETTAP